MQHNKWNCFTWKEFIACCIVILFVNVLGLLVIYRSDTQQPMYFLFCVFARQPKSIWHIHLAFHNNLLSEANLATRHINFHFLCCGMLNPTCSRICSICVLFCWINYDVLVHLMFFTAISAIFLNACCIGSIMSNFVFYILNFVFLSKIRICYQI